MIDPRFSSESKKPEHMTIVRVSTEHYVRGDAVYLCKTVRTMKRISHGFDLMEYIRDEPEDVLSIQNLHEVDDGLYELTMTNVERCWETGHIDAWDYRLIPYDENQ